MVSKLSLADEVELVRLLTSLREHGGAVPDMPAAIWRAFARLAPQLVVEVLVTADGSDVICTWREDSDWCGWHVPGGFVGVGESAEDACVRIARRELGLEVEVIGLLGTFAWPDHPYAAAVSLLCVCSVARGTVVARTDGTLFHAPPNQLVAHHDRFLRHFFATAPHRRGPGEVTMQSQNDKAQGRHQKPL